MFILLLFNKDSRIRFLDIAKSLFRQDKDYSKLKALLTPLLISVDTSKNNKNGRILLVEKSTEQKMNGSSTKAEKPEKTGMLSIEKNDFIVANNEFFSYLTKNKVKEPTKRLDTQQAKELDETVSMERKFSIDACIVRIMKARKSLKHSELISEVSAQLMNRFQVNPLSDIKPRIEHLIETEFDFH